jgi:hypothetical protein
MSRSRRSSRILFSGALALAAAWALVETLSWPIMTALYPRAIGIPLLVLAIAETVLNVTRRDDADGAGATDIAFSSDVPPDVAVRRTVAVVAWMVGFYVAIILIGFPRAVPLFVLAYLRVQGRERWIIALSLAAVAWLAFYLVFVRVLHLPFDDGLLQRVL